MLHRKIVYIVKLEKERKVFRMGEYKYGYQFVI